MLNFKIVSDELIEVLIYDRCGNDNGNHVANLRNYSERPEWFLVNIYGVIRPDELRQIADKLDELNKS